MQSFQAYVLENGMIPQGMIPQGFNSTDKGTFSTDKGTLTVNSVGVNWVGTNSTVIVKHHSIQKIRADYESNELNLCLDKFVDGKRVRFAFDDVMQRDYCTLELQRFKNSKRSAKKKRKKKSILSVQQKKQKRNSLIRVFSTDATINRSSEDIWRYEICQTFLNVVEFAELRVINKTINGYWRVFIPKFMRKAVIRVEKDIPRLSQALALANAMWVPYYDKYDKIVPLKIDIPEGHHFLEGSELPIEGYGRYTKLYGRYTKLNRSHITIVGEGYNTIIHGAFFINNQKDIKIESLTLTNQDGTGLLAIGEETELEVSHCLIEDCENCGMQLNNGPVVRVKDTEFKKNGQCGLRMYGGTLIADECDFIENGTHGVCCTGDSTVAKLDNCTMSYNCWDGLFAGYGAVVDIRGTATELYANYNSGIRAKARATVFIHLPWEHNTTHDNIAHDQDEIDSIITNIGDFTNIDGF